MDLWQDGYRAIPSGLARFGQSVVELATDAGGALTRSAVGALPEGIAGDVASAYYEGVADFAGGLRRGAHPLQMVGGAIAGDGFLAGLENSSRSAARRADGQELLDNSRSGAELIRTDVTSREALPSFLQPETMLGSFASGIVQFAVPYGAVTKAGRAYGIFKASGGTSTASKLVNFGRTTVAPGALTDFIAFSGDEGNLGSMALEMGFNNPLVRSLAIEEDDGFVEARLKNVLEGAALGSVTELLMRGFRGALRRNGEAPDVPVLPKADLVEEAEAGQVSPAVVEKLAPKEAEFNWADDPDLRRDGPARRRLSAHLTAEGAENEDVTHSLALVDGVAALWAKRQGKTLDDFYNEKFATPGSRGAAGEQTSLFQGARRGASARIRGLPRDVSPALALRASNGPLSAEDLIVPTGKNGRPVAADVGRAMDQAYSARWRGPGDFANPAHQRRAVDAMTQEVKFQAQQARAGDGWYSTDVEQAFKLTEEIIPELAQPEHRALFALITGIHSNGQSAVRNWQNATAAYRAYLDTGAFPTRNPANGELFGTRGPTIAQQAQLATYLVQKFDGDLRAVQEFLEGTHPLEELDRIRVESGVYSESTKVPRAAGETEALGYRITGGKVGNFSANLVGQGEATIDRWAIRTVRRHFGRMLDGPTARDTGLVDSPTESDRTLAQNLMRQVAQRTGYDEKDVQALLWFFEQGTFTDAGVKSVPESFTDGARQARADFGLEPDPGRPYGAAVPTSTRLPDGGGTPPRGGRDSAPPSVGERSGPRRFRLFHFSESPRTRGLSRRFAGTGRPGQERVLYDGLQRDVDGALIDADDVGMVHAYLPGVAPETNLGIGNTGQYLHEIDAELNLLSIDSDEAVSLTAGDRATVGARIREAGYDGVVDYDLGRVQLFRDVHPRNIPRIRQVDQDLARAFNARRPSDRARLFQGERGMVEFDQEGRALITLFDNADSSTIVHELSHVIRNNLDEIDPELATDFNKHYEAESSKWTVDQEEAFAKDFETYLQTGEPPAPALARAFQALKEAITRIYEGLLASGRPLRPEVRDSFDALFGRGHNRANILNRRPSTRPPGQPSNYVRSIRQAYAQRSGQLFFPGGQPYAELDIAASQRVADAYGKMKHQPNDPKVKASYDALKSETRQQYETMQESGVRLVFTRQDPYTSSQAMMDDIEQNKRLFVFLTEDGSMPSDHPLAERTGIVVKTAEGEELDITYNDLFRGVHDFFGHASEGYQFGHRGEENAWLLHSQMYSDAARPAMTTETRGQNSWVNAGSHLRRPDGSLPERGDADWVHPKDRAFASQKAGLLPKYALRPPETATAMRDAVQETGENIVRTLKQAQQSGAHGMQAAEEAVGTHVNYGRIKATSDVIAAIRSIEPMTQKLIDEEIGSTRSLEEVAKLADELGADPQAVVQALKDAGDSPDRAVTLVSGRILRNTIAAELASISSRITARSNSGQDAGELAEQLLEAANALERVDTLLGIVQKDTARGVQSGNLVTGTKLPENVEQGILKALREQTQIDETLLAAADEAVSRGNGALADALSAAAQRSNPERVAKIAETINMAAQTGETARVVKKLRELDDPTLMDAFVEYRGAMILSGPRTFAINWVSGALATPYLATSRFLGAAATLNREELRSSVRMMVNLVGSLRDIMLMFTINNAPRYTPDIRGSLRRTITEEIPQLTGTTGTESRRAIRGQTFGLDESTVAGRAVNAVGRVVRLPFSANQLGEEFWSQINYLAYIRTQALDAADDAIWKSGDIPDEQKGAAALAFVDQYVRDAFDQFGRASRDEDGNVLHQAAVRYAKSANFMQDLEYGVGQTLTDAKRRHPWLGLIVPFVKAPTNLFRTAVRMTPGINIAQERHARRVTKMSAEEQTRHVGEMIFGMGLWGSAIYLAASGQITGNGPTHPTERDALLQAGWQPYSLVRTDANGEKKYISFSRLDPFATVLGLAADFSDVAGYMSEEEKGQVATAMLQSLANNFTSKTYTRGISDTMNLLTQPDVYADNFANQFVGSLMPNFFNQVNQGFDEAYRQPRTMLDAVKQRIPGMSASLPPRRDIFGRPTTPRGGYIPFVDPYSVVAKTASPVAFTEGTKDKVLREIARLQFGFGMPSESMSGVNLTTRQTSSGQNLYDRYVELSGSIKLGGATLHESVEKFITSSGYEKLPDTTGNHDLDKFNPRVMAIAKIIRAYRSAAKSQLLQEEPQLREELRLRRLRGQTGTLPSQSGPISALDLLYD